MYIVTSAGIYACLDACVYARYFSSRPIYNASVVVRRIRSQGYQLVTPMHAMWTSLSIRGRSASEGVDERSEKSGSSVNMN